MLLNVILAIVALIVIVWLISFIVGTGIGLIVIGIKMLFYGIIAAIAYVISAVLRGIKGLICGIYNKIRNLIMDHLHPDEGAYYIEFGPKNRKGRSRIRYISVR